MLEADEGIPQRHRRRRRSRGHHRKTKTMTVEQGNRKNVGPKSDTVQPNKGTITPVSSGANRPLLERLGAIDRLSPPTSLPSLGRVNTAPKKGTITPTTGSAYNIQQNPRNHTQPSSASCVGKISPPGARSRAGRGGVVGGSAATASMRPSRSGSSLEGSLEAGDRPEVEGGILGALPTERTTLLIDAASKKSATPRLESYYGGTSTMLGEVDSSRASLQREDSAKSLEEFSTESFLPFGKLISEYADTTIGSPPSSPGHGAMDTPFPSSASESVSPDGSHSTDSSPWPHRPEEETSDYHMPRKFSAVPDGSATGTHDSMPGLSSNSSSSSSKYDSTSGSDYNLSQVGAIQPTQTVSPIKGSTPPLIREEEEGGDWGASEDNSYASLTLEWSNMQPISDLTIPSKSMSSFSKEEGSASTLENQTDRRLSTSSSMLEGGSSNRRQAAISSSTLGSEEPSSKVELERNQSTSSSAELSHGSIGSDPANSVERGKFATASSLELPPDNNDCKISILSPLSTRGFISSINRMVSPGGSRKCVRALSSLVISRHSTRSQTSLVGQHLINNLDLDLSQDFEFVEEASMAYSEPSRTEGPDSSNINRENQRLKLDTTTVDADSNDQIPSLPANVASKRVSRRRNSVGDASSSSSSSTLSKSQSRHFHKKARRQSYDGALLQMVDSIHGSGSTMENFNDSLSTFNNGSFHSRRGSHHSRRGSENTRSVKSESSPKHGKKKTTSRRPTADQTSSLADLRSLDYVSSASSSSSFFAPGEVSAVVTEKANSRSPRSQKHRGAVQATVGTKAPRHRSITSVASSSSSESSDGRKERRRPPHKQARRRSFGSPTPGRADPPPRRRESMRSASSNGGSQGSSVESPNAPTPKRRSPFSHRIVKMEREDSGYFSAASSQELHASFSSRSNTTMSVNQAKDIIDQVDFTRAPRVSQPRAVRSASPIRARKSLGVEDLNRMRSSAPARLDRVRSPRRRNFLLAQQVEMDRSMSQRSASQRFAISKLVEKLSIGTLDEVNTSLPPRSPASTRQNARIVLEDLKPPLVDPKARTTRTSNRTLDIVPEVAEAKLGRHRSATESGRYARIGSLPFVKGDEDDSSVSSGSSSDSFEDDPRVQDSLNASISSMMGGYAWKPEKSISTHATVISDGAGKPPLPRHRRQSTQTVLSESSLSQASSESSNSSKSSEVLQLQSLSRMDSNFTTIKTGAGILSHDSGAKRNTEMVATTTTAKFGASPFARHNSLVSTKTHVSEASYDLQAYRLEIPSTLKTMKKAATPFTRHGSLVSSKTTTSEASYDLQAYSLEVPSTSESKKWTGTGISGNIDDCEYPVCPLSRIGSLVSAKSNVSDVSYDLNPVSFATPDWPFPPSKASAASKPSREGSSDIEVVPENPKSNSDSSPGRPLKPIDSRSSARTAWSEATYDPRSPSPIPVDDADASLSSEDSSFARHATSVGIEVSPGHRLVRRRRVTPVSPLPPSPPLITFNVVELDEPEEPSLSQQESPNPFWQKLELDKRRQRRLRNRLHAKSEAN